MIRNYLQNMAPKKSILIGVIFLILAGFLYWYTSTPHISAADTKRCEQHISNQFGSNVPSQLLEQCSTSVGMIAMEDAKASGAGAQEAAAAIAKANQADLGSHSLFMFLIGIFLVLGIVLTITGVRKLSKPNK